MIPDFLIPIIGTIVGVFLILGGIGYVIGFIRVIIELLKGNFPRGRGPFFW